MFAYLLVGWLAGSQCHHNGCGQNIHQKYVSHPTSDHSTSTSSWTLSSGACFAFVSQGSNFREGNFLGNRFVPMRHLRRACKIPPFNECRKSDKFLLELNLFHERDIPLYARMLYQSADYLRHVTHPRAFIPTGATIPLVVSGLKRTLIQSAIGK